MVSFECNGYKGEPLGRLIGSFAGYILRLWRLLGVLGKIVGPLGSLWDALGLPLAHFCMPLDSLWLTFGCLGRPLASLVNALGLLWAWLGPGREK